jgi:hypothetical protein
LVLTSSSEDLKDGGAKLLGGRKAGEVPAAAGAGKEDRGRGEGGEMSGRAEPNRESVSEFRLEARKDVALAGEGAGNVVFLRPYYRDSFCTGRAGSEGSMSDLQL